LANIATAKKIAAVRGMGKNHLVWLILSPTPAETSRFGGEDAGFAAPVSYSRGFEADLTFLAAWGKRKLERAACG
jgi:hypothetical protein